MADLIVQITSIADDIDVKDLEFLCNSIQDGFVEFANYLERDIKTRWTLKKEANK